MPAGRPTRYRKSYAKKAYNFCCEHGFTETELAEIFDVSLQTITSWEQKHPEFLASIRDGRDDYDSNEVEKSLRRRALGYDYKEITRELRGAIDVETGEGKLSLTKEVTKQVVADVQAIIFWLKNRKAHRWRDRQLHELTGPGGGPIVYQPIDRFVLPEEKDSPVVGEEPPKEQNEDYDP